MPPTPDEESLTGARPSTRTVNWQSSWMESSRAKRARDATRGGKALRIPGNAALSVVLELHCTDQDGNPASAGAVLYGVVDKGERIPLATAYIGPTITRDKRLVITTNGVTFDYYEIELAVSRGRVRASVLASAASGGPAVVVEHSAIHTSFNVGSEPVGFPTSPVVALDTVGDYTPPKPARASAVLEARCRKLYGFAVQLSSTAAVSRWVYVVDASALPLAGGESSKHPPIPIDPNQYIPIDKTNCPIRLASGLVLAISSTEDSYTAPLDGGGNPVNEGFFSFDWRA